MDTDIIIMKSCTKCGKLLPLTDYHRSKKEKDGRVDRCKNCVIVEEKKKKRRFFLAVKESMNKTGGCCGNGETCGGITTVESEKSKGRN